MSTNFGDHKLFFQASTSLSFAKFAIKSGFIDENKLIVINDSPELILSSCTGGPESDVSTLIMAYGHDQTRRTGSGSRARLQDPATG